MLANTQNIPRNATTPILDGSKEFAVELEEHWLRDANGPHQTLIDDSAEEEVVAQLKILIADDHEIICAGLNSMLGKESSLSVVATVNNGREALRAVGQFSPDVVLMGLSISSIDSIEACRKIKESSPNTSILIFSSSEDEDEICRSIEAGAMGYVLRNSSSQDLITAINLTGQGQSFFSPPVACKLVNGFRRLAQKNTSKTEHSTPTLTERETEILKLLCDGLSNRAIAEKLFISENTVKTHVTHVLRKINQPDRIHALLYARNIGLIEPSTLQA